MTEILAASQFKNSKATEAKWLLKFKKPQVIGRVEV